METKKFYLYKETLTGGAITLPFLLTSDQDVNSVYDILDDTDEIPETNTDEVVVGICESKLSIILKHLGLGGRRINKYLDLEPYLNLDVKLDDGDEYGKILEITNNSVRYVLNYYSNIPIEYVDFYTTPTTFKYIKQSDQRVDSPPYIMKYEGLSDNPKIISDVFIERGVTSGLDNMKRLKQVTNLNELIKYGLGYFNVTTKAIDFTNNK